MLPSLVEVYANHVLSADSTITGSDEVDEASKCFVKKMVALASKITVGSWTVPPGLATIQTFSARITYFVGNGNKDAPFLKK